MRPMRELAHDLATALPLVGVVARHGVRERKNGTVAAIGAREAVCAEA